MSELPYQATSYVPRTPKLCFTERRLSEKLMENSDEAVEEGRSSTAGTAVRPEMRGGGARVNLAGTSRGGGVLEF